MVAHKALLGGESSGGLTIKGHILGKDGIFASALIVEMLAATKEANLGAAGSRVQHHRGAVSMDVNLPATPEMRIVVPERLRALAESHETRPIALAGYPVEDLHVGWRRSSCWPTTTGVLMRFSETEPDAAS